jgi:GH25 family lysozyme M1 (1,4-beta-N-acetylmuramidase)
MTKTIVDVSKYQGTIDYAKLKSEGVTGVIIRFGYGNALKFPSQFDPYAERNYSEAKKYGFEVGAYWYLYAADETACEAEMQSFLHSLAGKQFELPVYTDWEEPKHAALGKAALSKLIAYCSEYLERERYFAGFYCNTNYYKNCINGSDLAKRYTFWQANYTSTQDSSLPKCDIRQYTSGGKLSGINGRVDMNRQFKDFYPIILENGLNNFGKVKRDFYTIETGKMSDGDKETVSKLLTNLSIDFTVKEV